MNKGLTYFAIFATGIGIGIITTKQYFKNYYEQRYQEDISSVKEVFARNKNNKTNDIQDEFVNDEPKKKAQDVTKYSKKISDLGYVDYSSSINQERPVKEPVDNSSNPIDKPYIISPDEFGETDDYEIISLTYYEGDNVLTDDCDEIVEDIDNVVGLESLKHFGEYEEDVIHVRNDRLKADYEILLDGRTYNEVLAGKPPYR